jgi:Cu/Ag efflux protein CusF
MRLPRLFVVLILAVLPPSRDAVADDTAARHPPAAAASAAALPADASRGEVLKVDKAQGKVTLKHGPLDNLGMPGMTMAFKVGDPRMLDRVKQGDKVRFVAESVKGTLTVTAIEAASP